MLWEEAMEGYSFEERVSWLQLVNQKIDLCLSSHRMFRQKLIRTYETKLAEADGAMQKQWKQVLSVGGIAVASMAALSALYHFNPPEGSTQETIKSYCITTVMAELTAQIFSGVKLAWEYCSSNDGIDLEQQKHALNNCNVQLNKNEQDMTRASAHLIAADIRYEQLW
jgi:hypothetical protein